MPGRLAQVQAWAATHRRELLLGGGAGAVGLGVYSARRNRGGGDDSDQAASTARPAAGTTGYGVSQPADDATGGAAYDSTGNDVYNALQPQLEENQSLIDRLLTTVQSIPTSIPITGVPAPAGSAAAARRRAKPKGKPRAGRAGSKKGKKSAPRAGATHATRHPTKAPHKQGAKVTHQLKAGGGSTPHPQASHKVTTPRKVATAKPAPVKRRGRR